MNMLKKNNHSQFSAVVENPHSTVVAEYAPSKKRAESYQSEDALEKAFIKQLEAQAYEYLKITSNDDLTLNLRAQLEKLNNITFTDKEWEKFFNNEIANPNQSIPEKTATIQEDYIKNLIREDGSVKNIYLILYCCTQRFLFLLLPEQEFFC